MADTDPAVTLRRAAELAPKVLPARIGKMIGSSIGRFLPDDIKYAGDAIFEMAAEVLALAEQQQAQRQDAVETVDEALAEVRLHIGPNTRSLIADGHWKTMPLSLGERRGIAEIAVAAMKSR